MKNHR